MRKRSVIIVLLAAALSVAAAIAAQDPKHERVVGGVAIQPARSGEPWLLDTETRLQLRFDAQLHEAQRRSAGGPPSQKTDIDGSKDPELLLPWEVHRFLLSTAFYADDRVASAWRRRFQAATPSLGITDAFWQKLRDASSEYLRDWQDSKPEHKSRESMSAVDKSRDVTDAARAQCHSRMVALQRANAAFGKESFAKFLYLSVAPAIKISAADAISADRHRYISGGCE